MNASEPPRGDPASAAELAEQQEAARRGEPYFLYRDHRGRRRVFSLPDTWERATIGRSMNADLILSWDAEVSSIHAELARLGDDWVLVDDGLSRNGSFLNGERVSGRRRLAEGDVLRLGQTTLAFHAPFRAHAETVEAGDLPEVQRPADAQRPSSSPGEAPRSD